MSGILLAPSLFAADFLRLGEALAEIEAGGADWIHVDVMDGKFVPAISFGARAVEAFRRSCRLPLDVHLMCEAPEPIARDMASAGARIITFHYEATRHPHRLAEEIRSLGCLAGVAMNPGTPVEALGDLVDCIDLALLAAVDPGASGRPFQDSAAGRIARLRELRDTRGGRFVIEVDGGLNAATARIAAGKGAGALVLGSSVFGAPGGAASGLRRIRESLTEERGP